MKHAEHVDVKVMREYDLPSDRVFDAWLDPESAGKWLFATPTGNMVRVELDPRVGGEFTFVDRRDGEDVEHTGIYLEIDRPRRLSFNFSVPRYSAESSRIVVDIVRLGAGCELTLTQIGADPESAARAEAGWKKILEGLADSLAAKAMA